MVLTSSAKELEVTGKLVAYLKQEEIAEGGRLPSERSLAEKLGTSRNTLRGVIKMMQARGLLEAKAGSGYYLVSKTPLDELEALGDVNREKERITDQLEAFYFFEPKAVVLAAGRMTDKEMKLLEEQVVGLSHAILENNIDKMVRFHKSFHEIIARGTHNITIEMMLKRLETTYSLVANTLHKISPEERNTIFARHVNLYKALSERDEKKAQSLSLEMTLSISRLLHEHEDIELPDLMK